MKNHFERAVANITTHGDTDIFPFPIENHILFDKPVDAIDLLIEIDSNFRDRLARTPPVNYSALTPVSYTGFRWATQIDPLWNAYLLGVVLSVADEIEQKRIPTTENVVFSYRFDADPSNSSLFQRAYNWRSFMERSLSLAKSRGFVVLSQIDSLLRLEGIEFCRFADDFHLFSDTYEGAFRSLVFLSEKLLMNQGLQLQKSKTRIMSGAEFISTSPLGQQDDDEPDEVQPDLAEQSHNLMRLSLRFDPYSPTAADDYEALRLELQKIDIFALLKAELVKSRIHISLSKKIVSAIRYVDEPKRSDAVLSLIRNETLLYPIYSNILWVVATLYPQLPGPTCAAVVEHVRKLITDKSHVLEIGLNLQYAVRLIALSEGSENEETLNRVFKTTASIAIRRDIILAMGRWTAWTWLSDLKNSFRTLSPMERRAFIVASYVMSDEGRHWRQYIAPELSPFEELVRKWASEKAQASSWRIPV